MEKTFLPLFDQAPSSMTPVPLSTIREELGDCVRCGLCKARRNIVFGQGNVNANLMFVGEGPGEEEDRSGLAFVGRAGRLLTELIIEIGFTREEVYIANIVKCRPPNNREPEKDEIAACAPFLRKQIISINPVVIVALGRPAANHLTSIPAPISKMRGVDYRYKVDGYPTQIRIMATYHPAYVLRQMKDRKGLLEDLQLASEIVRTYERTHSRSDKA